MQVVEKKIEKLKKWRFSYDTSTTIPKSDLFVKLTDIRDLPPVKSTRKKGKWIVEDYGNYNGKYTCYCSNCKDYYTRNWKEMKYCPNCGSFMMRED